MPRQHCAPVQGLQVWPFHPQFPARDFLRPPRGRAPNVSIGSIRTARVLCRALLAMCRLGAGTGLHLHNWFYGAARSSRGAPIARAFRRGRLRPNCLKFRILNVVDLAAQCLGESGAMPVDFAKNCIAAPFGDRRTGQCARSYQGCLQVRDCTQCPSLNHMRPLLLRLAHGSQPLHAPSILSPVCERVSRTIQE